MLGAGVPGGQKVTGEWSSGAGVTLAPLSVVKVTTVAGATQRATL
jgi:hypothetical protein